MEALVIAIDGPAGVGKTTTSKRVALALGIPHIDTGAMYRAIALKALRAGVSTGDEVALSRIAEQTSIRFVPSLDRPTVLLDGEDVSEAIRTPEISMAASDVSAVPAVRRELVRLQRELGRQSGGVLEGRDIGTKVFPDTPHKFFLTARPEVRAGRRLHDLEERGIRMSFEQVYEEMSRRDQQDSSRADSPLSYDESYTVIDTSDHSIDEVVDQIVRRIRQSSHAS
ncbi:MAG: (d)CMP kinase [Thermoanaerobaculia bacterium]